MDRTLNAGTFPQYIYFVNICEMRWARLAQSVNQLHGLGGPGIESRWGSTQNPVNWVLALFSAGKAAEVKERLELYL